MFETHSSVRFAHQVVLYIINSVYLCLYLSLSYAVHVHDRAIDVYGLDLKISVAFSFVETPICTIRRQGGELYYVPGRFRFCRIVVQCCRCFFCKLQYYWYHCANQLLQRLTKQLEDLKVPFVDDFPSALKSTDQVVDAIFGSYTSW